MANCIECTPGTFCEAGEGEKDCPAGNYCPVESAAYIPCESGTYNPNVRSESEDACLACPPQKYCMVGTYYL